LSVPQQSEGGKRTLRKFRYCVSDAVFSRVQARITRAREERAEEFRKRYAVLERALEKKDTTETANIYSALRLDVQREVMGAELYQSQLDGRRQSFSAWLREWRDSIKDEREIALFFVDRSKQAIQSGNLSVAENLLDESLKAHQTRTALELQPEIDKIRAHRADLLRQAEARAMEGRFALAGSKLRQAEKLDSDDRESLTKAANRVDDLQESYLSYNPRWLVDVHAKFGSLGFDPNRTGQRIRTSTNFSGRVENVLAVGVGAQYRFSRHLALHGSVSIGPGESQEPSDSMAYDYSQATLGLGFRTHRSEERSWGLHVLAGLAIEDVKLLTNIDGIPAPGEAKEGAFVRVGFRTSIVSLWLQRGIGFETEEQDSLIGWTDQTQFVLALVF